MLVNYIVTNIADFLSSVSDFLLNSQLSQPCSSLDVLCIQYQTTCTVVPESLMTSSLNVPLSTSDRLGVVPTSDTQSNPSSLAEFTTSTTYQSDVSSSFDISSMAIMGSSTDHQYITDGPTDMVTSVFAKSEINPTASSQPPSSTIIAMRIDVSEPSTLLTEPGPSSLPSISPDTSVERAFEEFSNFQKSLQTALLANEAEISQQRASVSGVRLLHQSSMCGDIMPLTTHMYRLYIAICKHVILYVCMYVCIDICIYVCLYVCMYVHTYIMCIPTFIL